LSPAAPALSKAVSKKTPILSNQELAATFAPEIVNELGNILQGLLSEVRKERQAISGQMPHKSPPSPLPATHSPVKRIESSKADTFKLPDSWTDNSLVQRLLIEARRQGVQTSL